LRVLKTDENGLRRWVKNRYPSGNPKISPEEITASPLVRGLIPTRPIMRITFGNATVKRLEYERSIAEDLNHLRFFKITECLLRIHDGHAFGDIAQGLHISLRTVYNWLDLFIRRRFAWLSGHHFAGRGRKAKLNDEQLEHLYELIEAGPLESGFTCGVWTSSMIAVLIEREFGVTYNPRYLCRVLHQIGITYQKAALVSAKIDDEKHQAKRREWERQTWPFILKRARQLNAVILFGDEVSFAQWGSLLRTWAPRGKQPLVPTSGKRKGMKVFGAIEVEHGDFLYLECEGKFNGETYVEFLDYVISSYECPVILIEDGASYHSGPVLNAFKAEMAEQGLLFVERLPAYSPDKNPIEKLWKNTKKEATHCRYFETFEDLRQAVLGAFEKYLGDASKVICVMKKLRRKARFA
jgi:transposase